MKEWIEKNKILTLIIFWGGFILLIYLLSNNDVDVSARYRVCDNLLGKDRIICEQKVDTYLEQEEGLNQQRIDDSYRSY